MAKETLASKVSPEEIVISNEEVNPPNMLIDDTYGVIGDEFDYQLVEKKVAYRTGKSEDGENEGKVIQYIAWTPVKTHIYGRTPFAILENYSKYIVGNKFKKLHKASFDDVKQIYLDTQATIRQALKSSQFTDDIKQQGTLIDEIELLKSKLKQVNDILEEADELRELIKSKRKIIMSDEPKQRRVKLEE